MYIRIYESKSVMKIEIFNVLHNTFLSLFMFSYKIRDTVLENNIFISFKNVSKTIQTTFEKLNIMYILVYFTHFMKLLHEK